MEVAVTLWATRFAIHAYVGVRSLCVRIPGTEPTYQSARLTQTSRVPEAALPHAARCQLIVTHTMPPHDIEASATATCTVLSCFVCCRCLMLVAAARETVHYNHDPAPAGSALRLVALRHGELVAGEGYAYSQACESRAEHSGHISS